MKSSRTLLAALVPALLTAASAVVLALSPGATATTVAPSSAPGATVLSWHGTPSRARLPVGPAAIPGAPRTFRRYVRDQLRETWTGYLHHRPACKQAPLITVRHLRTDGFAYGYVNTTPQPGCQTGGGYVAFWAVRQGGWKQVIGTQDVPACDRLAKLDFPSSVATTQCYDGTNVVDYVHE